MTVQMSVHMSVHMSAHVGLEVIMPCGLGTLSMPGLAWS